jgi:hypothetical protein
MNWSIIIAGVTLVTCILLYLFLRCKKEGGSCTGDSDCCSGLVCSSDGKCIVDCNTNGTCVLTVNDPSGTNANPQNPIVFDPSKIKTLVYTGPIISGSGLSIAVSPPVSNFSVSANKSKILKSIVDTPPGYQTVSALDIQVDGSVSSDTFTIQLGSTCVNNCDTCSNEKCTKCKSGFGIDTNGTPDSNDQCPSYFDTVTFTLNYDTNTIKGNILTNIEFDSYDKDGNLYKSVIFTTNKVYTITCPMKGYLTFQFVTGGQAIRRNIVGINYNGPVPDGGWSSHTLKDMVSSSNFSDFVMKIIYN